MANKKLRLLLFEDCERNCAFCCNKTYDLDKLEVVKSFKGYKEILLTGGEPLLDPQFVLKTVKLIKKQSPRAKIYLYTAKLDYVEEALEILKAIDGMTVTLHISLDKRKFMKFHNHMLANGIYHGKSLRLKYEDGIYLEPSRFAEWEVVKFQWVEECPVPKGEDFMRAAGTPSF